MYPFKIPVERLNENEGTITFGLRASNLLDVRLPLVRIFEISKGKTVFVLERDANFDLRFIQSNPNYKTKVAKVNIKNFCGNSKIFITLSWSKKENIVYVGEQGKGELRNGKSSEEPDINFRVGKNGEIYQIGDKGIKVRGYRVKMGNEVVLEPTAKELFDFQLERVEILIKNCKKGDFMFESTLVQQIIVMLTTAFELYARTRFIELEAEGKSVNLEKLFKRFVSNKYREQTKKEINQTATKQGKTEITVFIERRIINFQDWKCFKEAYNKGYNLKVGKIGIPNEILGDVQKFIEWRHKIIHSKGEQTMINFEEVPPATPIFTTKELAEKGLNTFQKFVDIFHKNTIEI
jgi:hypothetical protein